ncbi:chromosome partitioning protein ParA, partial [Vibrio parahaemolyticus]
MEQFSLTYMLIGAIVILLVVGIFWVRKSLKLSQKLAVTETQLSEAATAIEEYKEKYSQIFDIEAECEQIKDQLKIDKKEIEEKARQALREIEFKRDEAITKRQSVEEQISELQVDYKSKKITYDSLTTQ